MNISLWRHHHPLIGFFINHLSFSFLSQNQSYSNNRWSIGTMNFIWSLSECVTWHDTFRLETRSRETSSWQSNYMKVYYIFNELKEIHSFIKHLLTLTWHKPNQTLWSRSKSVANQAVHDRHTCSFKPHWEGFARHVSLWCWWLVACIHSSLWLANVF